MCRSKKFVKRFHIQSQLYFRIHLLVKESNPARYAMSPPSASPRASCLSVNIGENCVLIKLFDPNVDLDFPKIVQNVIYITDIDLKGQDKLWGKNSGLTNFSYMCIDLDFCSQPTTKCSNSTDEITTPKKHTKYLWLLFICSWLCTEIQIYAKYYE